MSPMRQVLIAVHVLLGLLIVAALCSRLGNRAMEVNQVRITTHQEQEKTLAIQREITRMDELRKGIEHEDPYVIELLARQKLQYARPGEISPPQAAVSAPLIDRSDSDDTK
jgi:hypothetical protein